jgi:hypothetical protein
VRNGWAILPAIPTKIAGVSLHAANLRHGTDSFTCPPKEGMLWIFLPEKLDGFG